MSNLSISSNAFRFWTNFYPKDCEENPCWGLCRWAGEKAYLDMNRTLTFLKSGEEPEVAEEREQLRDQAIAEMFVCFGTVEGAYDTWHKTVCDCIIGVYQTHLKKRTKTGDVEGCDMTYGQAQKWLNMTIKYIWLVCSVYGTSATFRYYESLMRREREFHVPLDRYIIDHVRTCHRESGKPLPEAIKKIKSEWSRMTDYAAYLGYQDALKAFIARPEGDDCSPLEWELVHWHKAMKAEEERKKEKQKAKKNK